MQHFDDVFREQGPFVRRALLRMGTAEADVPDLLQEVFLVVLRRLGDFEGRSTLRTWLYGICMRVVAAQRRRNRRRSAVFALRLCDAATPAAQDELVALREHAAALDRCLARMSAEQRRVFVAFEIEERAMIEVAAELACPLKTAFSRLHAARRRVNESLARSCGATLVWLPPPALAKPVAGGGPVAAIGAGKPAALLTACALGMALFAPLPGAPAALSLQADDLTPSTAPTLRFAAQALATAPAPPRTTIRPRTRGPASAVAPEAALSPLPPLEIVAQELPSVDLTFQRIALSEAIPIYRIR